MSDTIGAIFLIAIFAVATAIIGSNLLSQTTVIEVPATDLSLSINSGEELRLYNDGGDDIRRTENTIYVDGIDRTGEFQTETGDAWTDLEAGNYIRLELLAGEKPSSVIVVYNLGGGNGQLIATLGDEIISPISTATTPPTTQPTTATPTQGSPPDANFSGSPTSGTRPLAVAFTDLSTESPTTWAWTFGDGNSSNAQNPSHTYASPGTYTVSLTATNAFGSDTETKTGYITVNEQPPVANFSGSPTSGTRPLAVTFTDLSTHSPTEWAWTFGDGNTSNAQNPSHTYTSPGTYTVSLNATNSGGSDTETKTSYITVNEQPPVADFTADTTSGERPLTVMFTDLSTHSPTEWAWDFGDGNTSNAQNPTYTYVSAGTYTVSLNATNSGGSDTEIKTDYITVTEPLPTVIFFDDFEDGNLNGWTTRRAGTTSYPAIGSYSAYFYRDGWIEQIIPTTGYTGINVSFYLGAYGLDWGETVSAYWSPDGSTWNPTWNLLKQISYWDSENDGQLHFFSYELPATADDNPNFALRFSISAGNQEYGYVDNVQVEGYD